MIGEKLNRRSSYHGGSRTISDLETRHGREAAARCCRQGPSDQRQQRRRAPARRQRYGLGRARRAGPKQRKKHGNRGRSRPQGAGRASRQQTLTAQFPLERAPPNAGLFLITLRVTQASTALGYW